MQRATLFNPIDNSLETKVKSVRDVQKAYLSVKASLEYSKLHGYNQSLGTKEELDQAYIITKDSFKQAMRSLSDHELQKARKEELITTKQFQNLSVERHKAKFNKMRSNQMLPEDKQNVKHGRVPPSHKK